MASVLACATSAMLAGVEGIGEMAEFVVSLDQRQLRCLKCWYNRRIERYVPPSESTLRRVLGGIDPTIFDGRVETREIQCRPIKAETFGFPFATQLALIRRHRYYLCDGHEEQGAIYVLTSRDQPQASPKEILAFSRGHWGIEIRVHYTRDANYHEDRCRIRHETTARVCATLRTLSSWLLGKKADGKRRNTRRRQHVRLACRANKTVRLILSNTP